MMRFENHQWSLQKKYTENKNAENLLKLKYLYQKEILCNSLLKTLFKSIIARNWFIDLEKQTD